MKIFLFAALSIWITTLSWRSLRVIGSHGSYRYFAWEAILALFFINVDAWFVDAFSSLHIVSWSLLAVSVVMVIPGGYTLLASGKAASRRNDDTLFSFEKTTVLVTDGIYRYIRHPLYGSLLFLAWGVFLKDVAWTTACLISIATVCLIATSKADETECIRYFGPSYEEYMKHSKMFIPFLL